MFSFIQRLLCSGLSSAPRGTSPTLDTSPQHPRQRRPLCLSRSSMRDKRLLQHILKRGRAARGHVPTRCSPTTSRATRNATSTGTFSFPAPRTSPTVTACTCRIAAYGAPRAWKTCSFPLHIRRLVALSPVLAGVGWAGPWRKSSTLRNGAADPLHWASSM
jgi:hypothetical protein